MQVIAPLNQTYKILLTPRITAKRDFYRRKGFICLKLYRIFWKVMICGLWTTLKERGIKMHIFFFFINLVCFIFLPCFAVFLSQKVQCKFLFSVLNTHSQGRLLKAVPTTFWTVSQLSQENAPRQFPTIYFLDQGKPMALFKTADSEKYLDTSCVAQPMKSLFPEEMQVKCKFQVFSRVPPSSSIS